MAEQRKMTINNLSSEDTGFSILPDGSGFGAVRGTLPGPALTSRFEVPRGGEIRPSTSTAKSVRPGFPTHRRLVTFTGQKAAVSKPAPPG